MNYKINNKIIPFTLITATFLLGVCTSIYKNKINIIESYKETIIKSKDKSNSSKDEKIESESNQLVESSSNSNDTDELRLKLIHQKEVVLMMVVQNQIQIQEQIHQGKVDRIVAIIANLIHRMII